MLVPMRDLLDKATIEGYGVVAPNVINECTARVCIEAAEELHAPLILDVGYVFHPDLVFPVSYTHLTLPTNSLV